MLKEKISVFGSTGFIGSKFCEIFEKDVIKVPRNKNVAETSNILYFISTNNNYNVFDKPHLDIETNLSKLISVLESNRSKQNLVFNFVSSWFVYGKTESLPVTENDFCNPKGFYSITKRCAEQLLISYCETYNIKYRIFRLCNVLGESDKGVSNKKNALQNMIEKLVFNEQIRLYEGGSHIRDYMYVDDVCRAIKHCLEKIDYGEIVNIGSGTPTKIKDVIEYCRDKINSKSEIISIPTPEFHKVVQVENMYLDVKKLTQSGFEHQNDLWFAVDKILDNLFKSQHHIIK
jgi:nucleoside-diphosphate-sugar epimerase